MQRKSGVDANDIIDVINTLKSLEQILHYLDSISTAFLPLITDKSEQEKLYGAIKFRLLTLNITSSYINLEMNEVLKYFPNITGQIEADVFNGLLDVLANHNTNEIGMNECSDMVKANVDIISKQNDILFLRFLLLQVVRISRETPSNITDRVDRRIKTFGNRMRAVTDTQAVIQCLKSLHQEFKLSEWGDRSHPREDVLFTLASEMLNAIETLKDYNEVYSMLNVSSREKFSKLFKQAYATRQAEIAVATVSPLRANALLSPEVVRKDKDEEYSPEASCK